MRVTRFVTGIAADRILNAKTARSQIIGGIVFGISMALLEQSVVDSRLGWIATVYHATGKRIRDLPITLDKLL